MIQFLESVRGFLSLLSAMSILSVLAAHTTDEITNVRSSLQAFVWLVYLTYVIVAFAFKGRKTCVQNTNELLIAVSWFPFGQISQLRDLEFCGFLTLIGLSAHAWHSTRWSRKIWSQHTAVSEVLLLVTFVLTSAGLIRLVEPGTFSDLRTAVYFVWHTVTTTGYGDITAQTWDGRWAGIAISLIGIPLFSSTQYVIIMLVHRFALRRVPEEAQIAQVLCQMEQLTQLNLELSLKVEALTGNQKQVMDDLVTANQRLADILRSNQARI